MVSETEHFRYYYDKKLEKVAGYVAGIAEQVYQEKVDRYQIQLPGKVEMIVRDDIYSNGWANSYQNTMTVWVTDWGIPLRSTHNWLRDVVTHELSHLISIQTGSKFPTSIFGVILGYQDYYNEDVQSSLITIFPFSSQPNWLAEGVAQYESELSGYDHWDSHRDMIVRTAVLSDSLLDFHRMGTFAGKGLHFEQGPYTQGFAFVRYLAQRFGDEGIKKLWVENAKIHRQTISSAMKKMWGKSGPELWAEWQAFEKRKYSEKLDSIGQPVVGEKLTEGSFFNQYPQWNQAGDKILFVSNKGRKGFRGMLHQYSLSDTVKKEDKISVATGAIRGYYDLNKDDSTFLYASSKNTTKKGEARFDIYEQNKLYQKSWVPFSKGKEEKRLTKTKNAIFPSYNKDQTKIVFVRSYGTNFRLCVMDTTGITKKKKRKSIQEIFPPESELKGTFGFNVYTPKYAPKGNRILFSYYDKESRKIGLIHDDGTGFKPLLNRVYDDRDPMWMPDGKSFLFSSDSTGIYNIYQYNLETGRILTVTNTTGGAFSPSPSPDGKHVSFINYDKDGFSLYLLKNWSPLEKAYAAKKKTFVENELIEHIELAAASNPYIGIPNRFILQPIIIGQEITALDKEGTKGDTKWLVGLSAFLNDPVQKNEVSLSLLLEVGKGFDYISDKGLEPNKESELAASYWNHSTPVSIGASYIKRNLVSFDTIVTRSDDILGAPTHTVEVTNQAINLNSFQLSARYALFSGGDGNSDPLRQSFFMLNGGYVWNDFNFYEVPFDFTFYKDLYISPTFWYYGVTPSSKSNVAPKGMAGFFNYSYHLANLIRSGTFRETFRFENGVIKENFKDIELHEADFGLDYGLSVPWSKYSSIRLSTIAGSLLSWKNTSAGASDTLDSFFERGLFLRGYPYLQNTENLLFRGENTVQFGFDYNQVLLSDIYKTLWVVFLEDVYAQIFWDAGRAWTGKLKNVELFNPSYWDEKQKPDAWYQSVGWGLKLNSRIYHNYPFNVFFEAATALNEVQDVNGNFSSLSKIKMFGINTGATRISMGISLGFYNGLLSKKILNKRSHLSRTQQRVKLLTR